MAATEELMKDFEYQIVDALRRRTFELPRGTAMR